MSTKMKYMICHALHTVLLLKYWLEIVIECYSRSAKINIFVSKACHKILTGSCIGSVMPIIIIMPIIHYTQKLSYQDPGVVLVEVVATVRTVNLGAVVVLQELSDGGSIGLHKPKH